MTAPNTPNPPATPKSTFVTVVAWIFIVLSGLATFISLLQNVMLRFMPRDLFNSAMQDTTFAHVMPPSARFMFAHFQLVVLLFFVLSAMMLLSSIGLLRRRNWARLVFIGLLGLGIVYNIAGLVVQQSMMSSFTPPFPIDSVFGADSTFRQTTQQFTQMMAGMRVVTFIFAIGFAALFAWIIARLVSRPIREEFGITAGAA
jgi:uncharacterized membrane protein